MLSERLETKIKEIAHDALIESHRELLKTIEMTTRAYIVNLIRALGHHALPDELQEEASGEILPGSPRQDDGLLVSARRQAVLEALAATRWCKQRAAKLLGVNTKTLYNWISEFGVSRADALALTVNAQDVIRWDDIAKRLVLEQMKLKQGNKMAVARILGCNPKTLYSKLKEIGVYCEGDGDTINWGRNGGAKKAECKEEATRKDLGKWVPS